MELSRPVVLNANYDGDNNDNNLMCDVVNICICL